MIDIKSLTLPELQEEMEKIGEKKFRAGQIYEWMHVKLVDSFDEMTNLSKGLREKLKEQYELISLELVEVQTSKIDETSKFLFRLPDGNVIESVLDGLERGLKPSEMLDQIYKIQKWSQERVHNVVVMGTGEPLDNYDSLLRFIHLLTDEGGLHISQRNLTVSTCGIVPNMRRLADEKLQITLALSLHASSQEKRKTLMPVAYKFDLKDVLDACRYYFEQTGRRITFEYSLVGGVNDSSEDARELTELVKDLNCHINLIPVNPIKERDYVQSDSRAILKFKNKLEKSGINVTIRREMGRDIDGACGQLRKSYMDTEKER